ncbi:hypothetical protein HBI60_052760 [Parastagonospora nodorum]|nr:hypothetical protein HBI60_052760 [Parastagonospora nodorum]
MFTHATRRARLFDAWAVHGGTELPRPPLRCDDPADPMQRAHNGDFCGYGDECGETAQPFRGWNGLAHGIRAQQVVTARPTAAHRGSNVCPGCVSRPPMA